MAGGLEGGKGECAADGVVVHPCDGRAIGRCHIYRNGKDAGVGEREKPCAAQPFGDGDGRRRDDGWAVIVHNRHRRLAGSQCGVADVAQLEGKLLVGFVHVVIHNGHADGLAGAVGGEGERTANGGEVVAVDGRALGRGDIHRNGEGAGVAERGGEDGRAHPFAHTKIAQG